MGVRWGLGQEYACLFRFICIAINFLDDGIVLSCVFSSSALTTVPHFKKAHDVSLIRKPLSDHNSVAPQPVGDRIKPELGGEATPFTTASQQGAV